jgi:hypothetical protein
MTRDTNSTLVRWTLSIGLLAGLLTIVGTGCGGGGGGGTSACTNGTGTSQTCDEIYQSNATSASLARLMMDCTAAGGVASELCSHTGADGGCNVAQTNSGVTISVTTWYYAANAASEMQSCTSGGGTWIAP